MTESSSPRNRAERRLTFGAIVGVVELVAVHSFGESGEAWVAENFPAREKHFGNERARGRYGWIFRNPIAFGAPVPCRGLQSLGVPRPEAPDSDAPRAGVMTGMIVRTIGGRAVGEALLEARREVGTSSSERATRLLSYSRLVAGEPETQLELGLTRADGTPLEVALTRRALSAAP
jgi:hypothetical protein